MVWRAAETENIGQVHVQRFEVDEGTVEQRLSLEQKYRPLMQENPKLSRLVSHVGNKDGFHLLRSVAVKLKSK